MAWVYLLIAGCFEVGFTTSLKLSNNFSVGKWTVAFFVCVILSFEFLNEATKSIPMGTAYAVWTGIGAVGTAIIGMAFFNEPTYFARIFFLVLLIGSIIGLKFVS
ncbi:MAG: multidrug efflux SMR transporter [Bacteroidota bacterium]